MEQQVEQQPAPSSESDARQGDAARRSRRDLWQVPVLILGVALVIGGLLTARIVTPGHDFDGALDDAEALIRREEPQAALEILNESIRPHLDDPEATTEHRRRFHLLRGDAIFAGQDEVNAHNDVNAKAAIAEYEAARALLAKLDSVRMAAYVESLIQLDRLGDALDWIHEIPPGDPARRRLIRSLVERQLASEDASYEETLALLEELAPQADLKPEERAWIAARQAELRLKAGFAEEAMEELLRSMQRLPAMDGRSEADLYLMLARLYFDLGRMADARRQVERVRDRLLEGDPLLGEAHTLAGRIAQLRDDLQAARDAFTISVNEFPGTPSFTAALLGLGEVEAALGEIDRSIAAFERLVEAVREQEHDGSVAIAGITESLLQLQMERLLRQDLEGALRFAKLAEELHGGDPPAPVLLAVARTHRAVSDKRLAQATTDLDGHRDITSLDPVTRAEARAHAAEAGEYFLRHARKVLLSDAESFAESLWLAADSFDRAGELHQAIRVFSEYADGAADDARRPEAMLRLAEAHMALGDHDVAAQFLRDLIASNPTAGVGTRAYVPLARSLLLDDDPANDDEAERLLQAVVSGQIVGPSALEFREALVTLGRLHLRQGRLEASIARLREAVERFSEASGNTAVRFDLAEASRRLAGRIGEELREAMPEERRQALEARRAELLTSALKGYESTLDILQQRDARRLSEADALRLRNAMFFRADVEYDLGRYEQAIQHYDAAAQRYADDPASLVAMIQIVNAYVEQGRWREARTANDRARQRLRELPEEVFGRPDLPLDRRHWERWIESSAALSARADAGNEAVQPTN